MTNKMSKNTIKLQSKHSKLNNNHEEVKHNADTMHSIANQCSYKYISLVLDESWIDIFELKIKYIISKSIGSTFVKIVNKWNSLVIDYLDRYRNTLNYKILIKYEGWIKRIKQQGINSKMNLKYPV